MSSFPATIMSSGSSRKVLLSVILSPQVTGEVLNACYLETEQNAW